VYIEVTAFNVHEVQIGSPMGVKVGDGSCVHMRDIHMQVGSMVQSNGKG
jgi:hypothetical protein